MTKAINHMEEKKTTEIVETAARAGKKTAAKKTAAKTTTKKTVRKTAAKKAAAEAEAAEISIIKEEAAAGVKVQEEVAELAKKTAKAAPKKTTKKAAAKAAAPAEEKPAAQTEKMVQKEAEKGAEVQKAVAEEAEKKPAAKKTTRKTAQKKETAEKKPAAKKTTCKTAAKKTEKAEEKPAEVKTAEEKPAEEKAAVIVRPEARPAVKKEMPLTDAKVEKEVADKAEAAKKPAAAPAEEKATPAEEKPAEAVKEEVKKPLVELTDEKLGFYNTLSNDVLNDAAKALVDMDWNALAVGLQAAEDIPAYIQKVLNDNRERAAAYDFEKDGFDASALIVFAERIAETLPFKASDTSTLSDRINDLLHYEIGQDALANADAYHKMMDVMREVLMMGQRENITSLEEINGRFKADLFSLLYKFMDLAYATLPTWQYNDVKYYEGFLFGFLSQFGDLVNMHNRAMMDVADLYIKHGDFGKGDAEYNYVLRENSVKDQIYFRFADVYRPIDFQKAKSIAASALQYVDGRFDYYNRIMEILNS